LYKAYLEIIETFVEFLEHSNCGPCDRIFDRGQQVCIDRMPELVIQTQVVCSRDEVCEILGIIGCEHANL
jgi:hypothetical protein